MKNVKRLLEPLFKLFSNSYVPRSVIFAIDMLIVAVGFFILMLIGPASLVADPEFSYLYWFALYLIIYSLSALVFNTYRGVVRFSSLHDIYLIAKSTIVSTFVIMGLNWLAFSSLQSRIMEPFYFWFPFIHGFFVISVQGIFRIVVKGLFEFMQDNEVAPAKIRAFFLGVDSVSVQAVNQIEADSRSKYRIVAFVSLEKELTQKRILGVPVLYTDGKLTEQMREFKTSTLIVHRSHLLRESRQFYDNCIVQGLDILVLNSVDRFQGDKLNKGAHKITKIKIEDLLGRNVIMLDRVEIREQLEGERVLITGAAGSIGSEIARQVARYNAAQIVLLDQAETPLNNLWLELKGQLENGTTKLTPIIADVRNRQKIKKVFEKIKPTIIYHAAAYKHVPMMEYNPCSAVLTNVQGTINCAQEAVACGVKRFVMISTDKAVNPTSVMGATKRAAEIFVQSLALALSKGKILPPNGNGVTHFITTRFGNVLGSNGSVVPLFNKQIDEGGPVTVTHRDITRYFMTIPEACSLVLEAGAKGFGGEIYIFDMGEAVKIYDLAEKMIRLKGLTPGVDIEIKEVGLRPGEKLYEELLADAETTHTTYHSKIMIADVRVYKYDQIEPQFKKLIEISKECVTPSEIVAALKKLIPEYRSENSAYKEIDKELDKELKIEIDAK